MPKSPGSIACGISLLFRIIAIPPTFGRDEADRQLAINMLQQASTVGYALKKRFVEEPVNLKFPAWAGFIVLGDILVFVPIFIFVSTHDAEASGVSRGRC